MTPALFYIGIAVTAVIAVANIINSWLLARYNKQSGRLKDLTQGTDPRDSHQDLRVDSWKSRIWPPLLMLSGFVNIVITARPSQYPLTDAFSIAVGVFAMAVAVLLYVTNRLYRIIAVIRDVVELVTESNKAIKSELAELKKELGIEEEKPGRH